MCICIEIAKPEVRRRLTDLYRLPGFQTLASIAPHPNRPGAVVLRLRRLKKSGVVRAAAGYLGGGMTAAWFSYGRWPAKVWKSGSSTRNGG